MTRHDARLSIDFGLVGYATQKDKEPFRVTLDAAPLVRLLDHAGRAHRLYELALIERPGDVWDYVWVVIGDVPSRVRERMTGARKEAQPRYGEHPWPEGEMPFVAFDRLFFWASDDTDPECEAWLGHRDGAVMRGFARQLLAMAVRTRASIGWNDPLVQHVFERIRRREHAFDFLDRETAMTAARRNVPEAPRWTAGFYEKLAAVVRGDWIASIAYRGHGDSEILRILATEQRRRARIAERPSGFQLRVSALANSTLSNEAWDSEIWYYAEGLGKGDLYIDDGGIMIGNDIRKLIESRIWSPAALLLTAHIGDIGEIDGYVRSAGDGWVVYAKPVLPTRRMTIARASHEGSDRFGPPVLEFAERTATVFARERGLFVVDGAFNEHVTRAFTDILDAWTAQGSELTLVVLGEATALVVPDGVKLATMPDLPDADARTYWLARTLNDIRPVLLDTVFVLGVPEWARPVIADHVRNTPAPQPFVVASGPCGELHVDVMLAGDPAEELRAARERAVARRRQQF